MSCEEVAIKQAAGLGTTTRGHNPDFLKGITTSEVAMIHRLAGNDATVRKTTMKKLRKWLGAIATKLPDSIDSRELVSSNFGRVWKALFYCMWMADKPLPQETLAEQISNLVSIFSAKPNVMIFFTEWFFLTFAREWPWIDRLRLDKFMMLVRRFLRKMLQEFSNHDWDDDLLDQFLNVVTVHVFNHHPPLSKKASKKCPEPIKAPLGFQMHIVNIFLEELAKVGGSRLQSDKILKILTPFINELACSEDDRLLEEIKLRVFQHLMKQSDVGIDYLESRGGTMELVETAVDEEDTQSESSDMDVDNNHGQLDPRAGQVDVVLPQLEVNYEALVDMLKATAGRAGTRTKNRKLVLSVARDFQKLTKGQFPMGFQLENSRTPAIKRSDIDSAAKRLLDLETDMKVKTHRQHKSAVSNGRRTKKKVNFILTKNLEHVHSDYQASIQRSPGIPFDGSKVPTAGLLKSPASAVKARKRLGTEHATPKKPLRPIPRRKASDFF